MLDSSVLYRHPWAPEPGWPRKLLNLGHNLEILVTVLELLSGCVAVPAAPAGNPADLTSEPIQHGVTSLLGLPVTTRERLFARGLESVVLPPTLQGARGWELYSLLWGRVQPSSSERWVCTDAPRLGRLAPYGGTRGRQL
jgi:hypothetical protein